MDDSTPSPKLNHLDYLQRKVMSADLARQVVYGWKMKGERTAFTNGCFDLLHVGHLRTLAYCVDLADKVVVGLNSDASVKRLKGSSRPLVSQQQRALMLAGLQYVDAVVIFDEDSPESLIQLIDPEFLVKGGDWKEDQIAGGAHVKKRGGEVHVAPYLEGFSTTDLAGKLGEL